MSALDRFETFMEQLVERSMARLFRSPIQPAEIARRLERAMESHQTISVRRVIVPSRYQVLLHPDDAVVLRPLRSEVERELATYLTELAEERQFVMLEPPRVALADDDTVPRRSIQVLVNADAPVGERESTQRFTATVQRAHLAVQRAGMRQTIALAATTITIGRGLHNDIVLEDDRVSRRHAQLRYHARQFWLSDAGSMNGTYVNGAVITELALSDGDTISLGGLELTFHEA
jgi:hypothetical protein